MVLNGGSARLTHHLARNACSDATSYQDREGHMEGAVCTGKEEGDVAGWGLRCTGAPDLLQLCNGEVVGLS